MASSVEQRDDQRTGVPDVDALFTKLKGWVQRDLDRQSDWRNEAREDFGFTAGDQLTEADKQILQGMNRPIVIMNRVGPIIDSVSGSEVANRQEVQFVPREQGDVQVNEVLTAAAKWFRQQCDAEDEESDAFRDTIICGMGWTETRLDYEDEPDGAPLVDRIDPLEMVWDHQAKKRNLVDGRRLARIRRDVPISEARALCPGDPNNPFEDSDYNASWVDLGPDERKEPHHENNKHYEKNEGERGAGDEKSVTLVQVQWWEREAVYRVPDPNNDQSLIDLNEEEFKELSAKVKATGGVLRHVRQTRKVFKQAFIGSTLLEIGPAPCPEGFSFKCITGTRDRNKNTWYGLVRAMKDPARWANKWMMQTMHIMNTSAKGGIAAERGAFFEDDASGEASWAKQDNVTWLKEGALNANNPKWMQKPVSQFPASSYQLMEFAIGSIRDTSGVNVETLGQRSAAQAASLELQRKQSSMTILQGYFDSLRRYRKIQGRLLLYLIQNNLSDGRLVRIVGKDGEKYVPLVKQDGVATYDVVVDEAPSSPNQKEATWAMLNQILPVIGKMLPPATWLALLKYSPFPTAVQKEIADSLQSSQQNNQGDGEAAKFAAEEQRENAKTEAEIQRKNKSTDADILNKRRMAEAEAEIRLSTARASNIEGMLHPQPAVAADGSVVTGGSDPLPMILSLIAEMQQQNRMIAEALAAPKRIVRDPKTNEIVGTEPMRVQ